MKNEGALPFEQLVYLLVLISLSAFWWTLSVFGKFLITSLFVYSVDRSAVNWDTYFNLIYLLIVIYLHSAKLSR